MTTQDRLILGFPEYRKQTQQLAQAADLDYAEVQLHHFPDGESKVRLPLELPEHLIFCRSLHHPNNKLVELMLAAQGARNQGAKTLSLVAPYLCYMRQDKAFHPGEVVSQKIIGGLIASHFDNILTVDAHLHRVHHLADAVPAKQAINITATEPMARFLRQKIEQPLLIGPDEESEQWVAEIAALQNLDYTVATKQRLGDRDVHISLPAGNFTGKNIVLVDDVASTGKTLLAAVRLLAPYHPASISILVTHAFFVDDAIHQLKNAGVRNIWSCDSIPHPTNAISLADSLARNLDFSETHPSQAGSH
jgi:ribose-phosphate pyrophosphokinase